MSKKLMIFKSALAILLLLICFTGIGDCRDVKHGAEFTLAPLRLSQKDLILILQKVHSLISAANKDSDNKNAQERLSISGSGMTIGMEGEPQFIDSLSSLDVANSANYYYNSSGAAISNVQIQLHSLYRKVSIEGKSQEQIQALSSYIRQSFDRYTIWFGGIIGNISIAITIGLVIYIIMVLLLKKLGRKHGPIPYAIFFGIIIICVLFTILLEIIFIQIDLLPGIAIYKDDASIIVRKAPLISFIGVLAGIIIGITSIVITVIRSRHTTPNT